MPLTGLEDRNTLVISGLMAYSHDGEGLHRHVDPADKQAYLYAMSFLDAGPRWFACFDQPDLKSLYTFEIRAPEDWTVIGNGPSRQVSPGRWRIRSEHPLSTYFVTLVAGPYVSVHDTYVDADGEPIRLGLHVRASLGEHLEAEAADMFAVTKECFDYYHRVFQTRYPFGDYHQAFVPDFNAGAMENPGCVTFRDSFVFRARATEAERASRAGVIAHEMAHQWFGDLVTMTWWDDLWLNESFAEYMAHRCCTEIGRYPLWTEFGIVRKSWGSAADQGPSTHPVAGNGAVDAESALQDFDGISYAKGASLLKQLVAFVSDEVFLAGLRHYFDAHAFGNAALADLLASWIEAGASGLDEWAAQWLRTSGMDTIVAEVAAEAGPASAAGEVATIRRLPPSGSTRIGLTRSRSLASICTAPSRAGPRSVWAPRSRACTCLVPRWSCRMPATTAGPRSASATRRGRCCPACWPGVLRPRPGWSSTTRSGTPSETPSWIRRSRWTSSAPRSPPSPPTWWSPRCCGSRGRRWPDATRRRRSAPARTATVQATARAVLLAAGAGSDRQLVAFRAAIASSIDTEELAAWLAGDDLPEGIRLDPELTWAIAERATALGADPRIVEELLSADRSASAQVHAARARASRPDPAAKASAWELLTRPSDLSAYEVYATAEGFFLPWQWELTAPYVRRYFDEIGGTAAFRTGWALGRASLLAFPIDAGADALSSAEEALARADLAAPIRRSLADGTDELRRAVASRSRWFS